MDIRFNPKIGADWQLLGSKSALSRRARMKSTISPVRCTAVRERSATLVEIVNFCPHLSVS